METTSTTTDASAVNRNFAGAALLLAAAEAGGLPSPFAVSIDEYSIRLTLHEHELTPWAEWIDEPITEHAGVAAAEAELMGFRVRVGAVVTEPRLSLVGA